MARQKEGKASTKTQQKKRPGIHSKNASKGQTKYKQKSRGQGKS